jgi:hypothetical protein
MTTTLERFARDDRKKSFRTERDHIAQFINMNTDVLCTVQKWHTSSRKISLRRANCLAKINHAGCGAALLEASHMYRSSLSLAFCILYSATGAASDLSSVYVAPGGIYAPSANVYVRPGHTQRPYAESGYGYRQPTYVDPAYRAPAAVYGDYGPGYAARPVYVDRTPAYQERYYARERYAQEYDYEYAPRPPLPVPYRSRVRSRCDDGYGGWTYCD